LTTFTPTPPILAHLSIYVNKDNQDTEEKEKTQNQLNNNID